MRVISGKMKGRRLSSTKDKNTRPTEDRIKEAIFNSLSTIDEKSYVLDLFAGTGSIGIEFLSRGAKFVVFSDLSKINSYCIKDNLTNTGFLANSKIYVGDYIRNLKKINKDLNIGFDYIYLDPPYKKKMIYYKAISLIKDMKLLNKDGLIIVESNSELELNNFNIIKEKKYGDKFIYYLTLGDAYENNLSW